MPIFEARRRTWSKTATKPTTSKSEVGELIVSCIFQRDEPWPTGLAGEQIDTQ